MTCYAGGGGGGGGMPIIGGGGMPAMGGGGGMPAIPPLTGGGGGIPAIAPLAGGGGGGGGGMPPIIGAPGMPPIMGMPRGGWPIMGGGGIPPIIGAPGMPPIIGAPGIPCIIGGAGMPCIMPGCGIGPRPPANIVWGLNWTLLPLFLAASRRSARRNSTVSKIETVDVMCTGTSTATDQPRNRGVRLASPCCTHIAPRSPDLPGTAVQRPRQTPTRAQPW